MTADELFMSRAIFLAQKSVGYTYPNPVVGCVIVSQGQIIGEGYHHRAGGPHAEVMAVQNVTDPSALAGSTVYVTLEPCSHWGRTPPCASMLIEKNVGRVVVGSVDPNPLVAGRGLAALRDAGIRVDVGVMAAECDYINRRFFTFHRKKRPYITLKWAQSADGFMDNHYVPAAISSTETNILTHYIRRQEEAILVGRQTVVRDNPSLTVRHVAGEHPIRIILDTHARIPNDAQIFDDSAKTLIFNTRFDKTEGLAEWIILPEMSLTHILDELYRRDIQSVLVEGGAQTLQSFLSQDKWDEAVRITNQTLIFGSGTAAPQITHTPTLKHLLGKDVIELFTA